MISLFGLHGTNAIELLTRAAAIVWDTPLPALAYSPSGKPYFPAYPERHFSLSHSGNRAVCALSSRPVGIDIEEIRPRRPTLPARVLSAEELEQWDGTWADFYRFWTRKEAFAKYTGEGLRRDLRKLIPPPELFVKHYVNRSWVITVCGEEEPPAAWGELNE